MDAPHTWLGGSQAVLLAAPARAGRMAAPDTDAFINLLAELRAIVFCGRRAQYAERFLSIPVKTFRTSHPGAMAYNRPKYRKDLHDTLASVHAYISTSSRSVD